MRKLDLNLLHFSLPTKTLHLVEKNVVSPCVFWKKSMLSAGKKGEEGVKDERNDHFPTSSSWSEAALMEHRKKGGRHQRIIPKGSSTKTSPAASLLHSPIPLWRGNLLHFTPCTQLCFTMNNWVLLSAHLSAASIFCCLMIFFFPNRAFHSVEISLKGFHSNTLHFQVLNGNYSTFARLISYQKAAGRQKTEQTDRWIKYKGQGKCACWCTLSWSKKIL